jgi:hypothetical protein
MINNIHFTGHPHALVKDNVVINVILAEHDDPIIDVLREENQADESISWCEYDKAIYQGYIKVDGNFIPQNPGTEGVELSWLSFIDDRGQESTYPVWLKINNNTEENI